MPSRKAIVSIPLSELVDILDLPEDFDIQDVKMEFNSDRVLIKVKSPRIREIPDGAELPHCQPYNGYDMLLDPNKITAGLPGDN